MNTRTSGGLKNAERVMERKRLFRLVFQGDRTADALALEHWNPDEMTKLYESRSLAPPSGHYPDL